MLYQKNLYCIPADATKMSEFCRQTPPPFHCQKPPYTPSRAGNSHLATKDMLARDAFIDALNKPF